MPKIHPSLTSSRILEAVQRGMFSLDNPGFCISCGEEIEGVEPDARRYPCDSCGSSSVYGAEELLLMTAI